MDREADRAARARAEAEWVWPALCVSVLWAVGLLLGFPWLLSSLGPGLAALLILVMLIYGKWRSSLLSAVWAGGALLCAVSAAAWLFLMAFFRIY
jgi:hypothetical protein